MTLLGCQTKNSIDEVPNDYFHHIPCPVCDNSTHFKSILKIKYGDLKQKKSLDYTAVGITKDTVLSVKRCLQCGFVFVNPRIKPEYQYIIYNESKKKMYEVKPQLVAAGTRQNALAGRRGKIGHIEALLETLYYVNLDDENLTLFDYGCGFGYSMSLAREFGLNVYGVDIDKKRLSVCEASGLRVADPAEFDKKYPDVKADIIFCQSNIEHVVDLPVTIDYLRKKSKRGAILYIDSFTPRVISIEKKRGEFIKAHFVEHINFFTIKTLDRLMSKYGFMVAPRVRVSIVKTFKDTIKKNVSYLLLNTIGGNPLSTYFTRIYQYNP